MLPMNWPAGRGREQRGEPLERVRRAERVVLGVGREHVEPPVLHELARVRHVPRAQRVQLDEVGDPLPWLHSVSPRVMWPIGSGASVR